MRHSIKTHVLALALSGMCVTQSVVAQPLPPDLSAQPGLSATAVEELLNQSLAQKKGMLIYVGGQVINAVFVKRIDGNTIEVRNQMSSRIIIRVNRIDAIALS